MAPRARSAVALAFAGLTVIGLAQAVSAGRRPVARPRPAPTTEALQRAMTVAREHQQAATLHAALRSHTMAEGMAAGRPVAVDLSAATAGIRMAPTAARQAPAAFAISGADRGRFVIAALLPAARVARGPRPRGGGEPERFLVEVARPDGTAERLPPIDATAAVTRIQLAVQLGRGVNRLAIWPAHEGPRAPADRVVELHWDGR